MRISFFAQMSFVNVDKYPPMMSPMCASRREVGPVCGVRRRVVLEVVKGVVKKRFAGLESGRGGIYA